MIRVRFVAWYHIKLRQGLKLAAMSVSNSSSDRRRRFEEWIFEYDKHYNSEDEKELRFIVFEGRRLAIEAFNADPTSTYTKGLNQFSDMTTEEIDKIYPLDPMDFDTDDDGKDEDDVPVIVKSEKRNSYDL